MKKAGLATLIMLAAFLCQARLGETNTQIAQRYGAVQNRTETGTNTWVGQYTFKEYNVKVMYRNNTSECEAVWPIESRDFGDDERDTLMTNIAGGGKWAKDNTEFSFTTTTWINRNNGPVVFVRQDVINPTALLVCSREFADRLEAQEKEKEKKKADGF